MADDIFSVLSSADQIKSNYEMYKDKFVDSSDDIVNQETFLKLLVAEMSNQDPLEPTSNSEFISQLAQFSSMQYMLDSSKYAESNYAAGLVGKTVTATKMEGTEAVTKTGVVEKVYKGADNSYLVTVDGEDFALKNISSVQSAPENSESSSIGNSTSSLGDSISRAAMMVGMFATVQPSDNGVTVAGLIDAIRVKDGKIYAVINSQDYELDKLKEVTYAIPADDEVEQKPDNSDTADNDGSSAATNDSDGDDVQSTAVGAEM